jgi:hypothetical protein
MPEPVPPPKEWVSWNPCNEIQSQKLRKQLSDDSTRCNAYLKAVTPFSFFPDNIKYRVNQFSSFRVVTLGPVVSCTGLTEDKVVWPEDLTIGTGTNRVHSARLQINKNCPGNIFPTTGLIVVYINPLQLQFRLALVYTIGLDSMFIRDNFPELKIT